MIRLAAIMFYRKYRPQKFSEISKPNDAAAALSNQITSNKTGHAYLFIGPRGTGKTTTARIFTKALNCKHLSKEGDPCDKCDSCKAITEGRFLDLIEIDAASNRGIDDIRELKDKINLTPVSAKYKVYVVDEVHMLTMEAFNALLKTLEEPPRHAVFILCTTESHKVPDTIKSRCQVFKFKRASIKQLVERLKELCKKEGAKVSDSDLEKIASASLGGFRDADTLLQQVIEGGLDVSSLVGAGGILSFVKLTDYIVSGKTQACLELVNELFEEGIDLSSWTNEYLRYLRDLLYIQAGFEKGVSGVTDDIFAHMEDQASKLSSSELVKIIDRLLKASWDIKGSFIPSLPIEVALVEVSEREKGEVNADESEAEDEEDVSKEGRGKNADLGAVSFDSLLERWNEILKEVKPFNHSVEALLRSSKPASLKNNNLTLEVFYAFHKERLETPKAKEVIERVLKNMFGVNVKVKYVLKSKGGENLTDKNIELPKDSKMVKSAIEVFDGEIVV